MRNERVCRNSVDCFGRDDLDDSRARQSMRPLDAHVSKQKRVGCHVAGSPG